MKRAIILFSFLAASTTSMAQAVVTDLFQNNERLDITFSFHMDSLISDVGDEPDWHLGTMSWTRIDGHEEEIPVRARARGNFRRNKKYCQFPPLEIRIRKDDRRGTMFSKYKSLKMVTHCQDSSQYSLYVMREYLAYRLYNIISDYSYKVKLLKSTYKDIDGTEYGTFDAFLIEEDDELRDRIPATNVKSSVSKVNQDSFVPSIQLSMFQYMIGNTDWNVPYEHNIKLLIHEVTGDTLMVPFDFDHSGFVNTSYASAYRAYQLASPRERYYMGECYEIDEVWTALQTITDKKRELRDEVNNFPYLPKNDKKDLISFLSLFFTDAGDIQIVQQKILGTCGEYH